MHDSKGRRFFLKYSKSGRFLGFVRDVLKRDAWGRPVETAPFARPRQSEASLRKSGHWAKAAIALGVAMAEADARYMLARKARLVKSALRQNKPE